MKRLFLLGVVIVTLAAAPSAAAKACVRIQVPASAEVGETVRVVVRVYLPRWKNGRAVGLTPLTSWSGRLELALTGPDGRSMHLRTRGSRDGVGVVRFAFPSAGTWRLQARGWEYAPTTCAPARTVRVV